MVSGFDVILSFCPEDNKWCIIINKSNKEEVKTLAELDSEDADVCGVAAYIAVKLISDFVQEIKSKAKIKKESRGGDAK